MCDGSCGKPECTRDNELKEMADMMYTLYGYAIARGYNLDAAFEAVHESNMTKEFTPTGKIQKGVNYVKN